MIDKQRHVILNYDEQCVIAIKDTYYQIEFQMVI